METTETKAKVINMENMLERGKFEANGYTFTVRPVYFDEVFDYIEEGAMIAIPPPEVDTNDDLALAKFVMALFGKAFNETEKNKKVFRFKILNKLFLKKDYRYYSHLPKMCSLIKWIERKVEYKGKRIRFYDLERKFGLNKAEIGRLLIYFHKLSNFC